MGQSCVNNSLKLGQRKLALFHYLLGQIGVVLGGGGKRVSQCGGLHQLSGVGFGVRNG